MNSVNLTGNLGKYLPELRQTQGGHSVTSFDIAVKRPFSDETDWLTIVCWRQNAEYICRYASVGRKIEVTGYLQTRQYTDREGNERKVWEVVANEVGFATAEGDYNNTQTATNTYDGGRNATGGEYGATGGNVDDFAEIEDDGDLPF